MSQAPNLPATRPTSDLYGPDLVDDRPVKIPTKELASASWNQQKSDVAYIGQVCPLAQAYVPNSGAIGTVVALGTVPSSVVRNGAGDVTVTYPTSVRINGAKATSNTDGVTVVSALFTPGGQTVRVKSGGVDCNFSIEVF